MSSSDAAPSLGPTGEICRDLPSPYLAHKPTGLLHLPRFIAKIRKHLKGELPASYQRNFCKGFDGFLCLHLGLEPQQLIDLVREVGDDEAALDARLQALLPADVNAPKWNREVVQRGMSEMGQAKLQEVKTAMGIGHRTDLRSFADVIDYDEGRLS